MRSKYVKNRFIILLSTIVASIALYYISAYITEIVIRSIFDKFLARVFSFIWYFSIVTAFDVILLAILTSYLMIKNRRRGNVENYKGFLYSTIYTSLLALGYASLWIFSQL